jgi:hypothetical protein
VALIGVYLLIFGLWYPLEGNLWDYLSLTATIYLSSMSILLVAACYWKRANNWGAAGAITFGAVVPIAYLILKLIPRTRSLADQIGPIARASSPVSRRRHDRGIAPQAPIFPDVHRALVLVAPTRLRHLVLDHHHLRLDPRDGGHQEPPAQFIEGQEQ